MKKILTLLAALFVFSAYSQELQPIGSSSRTWQFISPCLMNAPVVLPDPQAQSLYPDLSMEGAIAYDRVNKLLQVYTGFYWADPIAVKSVGAYTATGLSVSSTAGAYMFSALPASPTQVGSAKLYNTAGSNTDGAMTQASIISYVTSRSIVNTATTAPTNAGLFTLYPNGTYDVGTMVSYPFITGAPTVYIKASTLKWLAFSATLF